MVSQNSSPIAVGTQSESTTPQNLANHGYHVNLKSIESPFPSDKSRSNLVSQKLAPLNTTYSDQNHSTETDSDDLNTLTPIKWTNTNYPVLKNNIFNSNLTKDDNVGHKPNKNTKILLSSNTIENQMYRENLDNISSQMATLIKDLNVIYQKIGYSKNDIHEKEKVIFKNISSLIDGFLKEANDDMIELSGSNDQEQSILNRILEISNDPSGTKTITDIYIRNAVIEEKYKTVPQSPKKEPSLLSKKNILSSAKKFVLKDFIPQLLMFLEESILLHKLYDAIQENVNVNEHNHSINLEETLKLLPNLQDSQNFYKDIIKIKDDPEAIMLYLKNNKEVLDLKSKNKSISQERIKDLKKLTALYKNIYIERLRELIMLSHSILDLLNQLHISPNDEFDSEFTRLLYFYSSIDLNNCKLDLFNDYISVIANIIESFDKIHKKYQAVYSNRHAEKNQLLRRCQHLWTILKVPNDEIDNFLQQNSNLSFDVIRNFEAEIIRLETVKQTFIKTLLSNAKSQIQELWEQLQYTEDEKMPFLHEIQNTKSSMEQSNINHQQANEYLDEKLLEKYNDELSVLKNKISLCQPVLILLKEFESMQQDNKYLEETVKDGSSPHPTGLHKISLKEEKIRKRITRHFPRLIQDLKISLEKLEMELGKSFMYKDKSLSEVLQKEEKAFFNKYPRSRLNISTRKLLSSPSKSIHKSSSLGKPHSNDVINAELLSKSFIRNSPNENSHESQILHQAFSKTPIGKSTSSYSSDNNNKHNITNSSSFDKSSIRDSSRKIASDPSSNFFKSPCFLPSPNLTTKLLPPTMIVKQSPSKIPKPIFKKASPQDKVAPPRLNSKMLSLNTGFMRPTTLFPLTQSKMNRDNSNIPIFVRGKTSKIANNAINSTPKAFKNTSIEIPKPLEDKENITPDWTPKGEIQSKIHKNSNVIQGQDHSTFIEKSNIILNISSPFRDINTSNCEVSIPLGDTRPVNISENINISNFDDTSIMDNENDIDFVNWKKQQLSKF